MLFLRSIASVIGGLACIVVIVTAGTLAASAALAGPGGDLTSAYLMANLLVSLAAAAAGAAVVVRLAPGRPLLHVGLLAAALVLLAVPGGFDPAPGQPGWYPPVVLGLGLAGIGLGALWSTSRGRRREANGRAR